MTPTTPDLTLPEVPLPTDHPPAGRSETPEASRAGEALLRLGGDVLRIADRLFWPLVYFLLVVIGTKYTIDDFALTSFPGVEAGDSAGDMLQVRRALERGWFLTGHHTDMGSEHPGPFGLWLKAVISALQPGLPTESRYISTMIAFIGLRFALLATACWSFARAAGSRLVGVVFGIGALQELLLASGAETVILGAFALNSYATPWAVLALMASIAHFARDPRGALPVLALTAGITAHLHTPTFAVGLVGLLLAFIELVRSRRERTRRWWTGAVVFVVFTLPFLVRAGVERGWPLTYIENARARRGQAVEEIAAGGDAPARTSLEWLEIIVNLSRVWIYLGALLLLVTGAALLYRRRILAGFGLLFVLVYAAVLLKVSPTHVREPTEESWLLGVSTFAVGLAYALPAVLTKWSLVEFLRRSGHGRAVQALAAPTRNVRMIGSGLSLLAAVMLTASVYPRTLDRLHEAGDGVNSGTNGTYVEPVADAIVGTRTDPQERIAVILPTPRWFTIGVGLILELEQREENFCVLFPDRWWPWAERFLRTDQRCATGDTYRSLILEEVPVAAAPATGARVVTRYTSDGAFGAALELILSESTCTIPEYVHSGDAEWVSEYCRP